MSRLRVATVLARTVAFNLDGDAPCRKRAHVRWQQDVRDGRLYRVGASKYRLPVLRRALLSRRARWG